MPLTAVLPSVGFAVAAASIIPPPALSVSDVPAPQAESAHVLRATAAKVTAPAAYVVRRGDTLSRVAARLCGNPGDYLALAYDNDVANPDLIYPGQVIRAACQAAAELVADRYGLMGNRAPAHPQARAVADAAHPAARAAVVTSVSGTFSCSALEALWEQAGGAPGEAFMAAEIAMAESGGNPNAVSPTDDWGLWQINASHGPGEATLNPYANARAAVAISGDGTNWGAWTTFTSGAYRGRC